MVNKAWVNLCGYTLAEVKGKTCSILQGPDTDARTIAALNAKLLKGERADATVTNYKKGKHKFINNVTIIPLNSVMRTNNHRKVAPTHFIARLREFGA